jgi:uncharacterized protein
MRMNRATVTIGLISDTHYGERCFDLPNELFQIWADINLILHAGDIGESSVVKKLSEIAPIIAVQGNDEPDASKITFLNKQIISIYGHKILLWHSHYVDPKEEKANRIGIWDPKLDRIASTGEDMGADIVIYGHTHIPMISHVGKTILFNPGTLASGSYFTRQIVKSVGILKITADSSTEFHHINLVTGQEIRFPEANKFDNFSDLADKYQEWIMEPDFISDAKALMKIDYRDMRSIIQVMHPIYKKYLQNGKLRKQELIESFRSNKSIDPIDREQIMSILSNRHH